MRLWHKDLIQILPRQQLLDQWRERYLKQRLYNLQEKADCGGIPVLFNPIAGQMKQLIK